MENSDYIRHKAVVYQRYKDNFDELTALEKTEFRTEVEQAFKLLPVRAVFVDFNPYSNVKQLSNDIVHNNRMLISAEHNESRLLPGNLNLKFRAVHDYLHYVLQAPFTASGEIEVYKLQKKFHKEGISQQILFSEVVLQACYQEYFGKFAEVQKVVLYNGKI